jgi:hypothetical protein
MLLTDGGGIVVAYESARPAVGAKLDATGEVQWKYGIAVEPEQRMMNRMNVSVGGVAPRLTIAGDTFVHASADAYCVRPIAADGDPLRAFARPFERRKFEFPKPREGEGGPTMVMIRKESSGGPGGGVKTDVEVGGHEETMTFNGEDLKNLMPEFEPDIRGVLAWPDGRIWVATSHRDDDTMTIDEWTVSADLLRTFEISADYDALRVGRDGILYAVGHDEDDFPIVWRLDVREKVEG